MDKKIEKPDYVLAAVLQCYELGESVPIIQDHPVAIDLFSLRKYLERFDLNGYNVQIVKIKNPVMYAMGFNLKEFGVTTTEEYFEIISGKLGCENTQEAISIKVQEILEKFKYEKI